MSLISFLLFFVILRRKLGGRYFNVRKIKRCVILLHKWPLQFTYKILKEILTDLQIMIYELLEILGIQKIKLCLNDNNIVNNIVKEDCPSFLPLNSSLIHPTKLQEQPASLSRSWSQLPRSLPPLAEAWGCWGVEPAAGEPSLGESWVLPTHFLCGSFFPSSSLSGVFSLSGRT